MDLRRGYHISERPGLLVDVIVMAWRFLLFGVLVAATSVEPFSGLKQCTQHQPCHSRLDRRKPIYGFQYGRGDEIWPPTNGDFLIDLNNSLVNPIQKPREPSKLESRRSMAILTSILISTLSKTEELSYLPLDALLLVALSGYFLLLHRLEILPTPTADDTSMISLYKEPLGPMQGRRVETWNNVGIYAGIVLPFLALFWDGGTSLQPMLIRPLLVYSAQALTENACQESALPIRALVPILYTVVRLCYWIYFAITLDSMPGPFMLSLGVINVWFAAVQLLLVLPYLALRYMRIHCFLVEAKSVELRSEASIGLTAR